MRHERASTGERGGVWSDEAGSASLEFLTVGLVLLVPLVYLVVALGQIQHAALGADAAARQIARAISLSSDSAEARARAMIVLDSVAAQYELDAGELDLAISCQPTGVSCPSAGATVRVQLQTRVTLPLAPPVLGLERLASVAIEAAAVQRMSRFWVEP